MLFGVLILIYWIVGIRTLSLFTLSLCVITVLGWLDDTVGDRTTKGFHGHWRKLVKQGVWTTGMMKAAGTSIVALILTLGMQHTWVYSVLCWFVIVLCTNVINLLDLRPGRALKCSFGLWLVLFIFGNIYTPQAAEIWIPTLISAVLLYREDVQGRLMLGDTGANAFGFALGTAYAFYAPAWLLCVAAVILVSLQWTAERSSITVWIERLPLLRWLDRLGRTP
ncbi:MraY family glycosyltransferase [Paenibacillus swuensis]|nr:hypothetical protein [Paenibacillus swuensis]